MGPAEVTETSGIDVGPHPHSGLQTVTWLLDGAVLHKDSLGSEQLIRPNQLNVMTAGRGVVHAEEAADYRGRLHGLQLWVAQSEVDRHGAAGFEHVEELNQVDLPNGSARLLAGGLLGGRARTAFPDELLGFHASLRPGRTELPLNPTFEHAVICVQGAARVGTAVAEPGKLAYLPVGYSSLDLECREDTELLVLGGEPLGERLFMWWNFVARSAAEIDVMYQDWRERTERFGEVSSHLGSIAAPVPPWQSLRST